MYKRQVLAGAGDRWAEASGGASGALWGAALTAAANVLGNAEVPTLQQQSEAVRAFVNAVQRLGGASLGDKTMLDAQLPFADAFEAAVAAEKSTQQVWSAACLLYTSRCV